jgi:hypothetical protein
MENLISHPFVLFLLVCLIMLILPLFLLRNLIRRDLAEDKRREQRETVHQETLRSIREGEERMTIGQHRPAAEIMVDLQRVLKIPPSR